jgi:hypothetical protein
MGAVLGTPNTDTQLHTSNTMTVTNKQKINKVLTGQPGNVPKKSDPISRIQGGGYKKKRTQHKMRTTRKTHKRRK